MTQVIPDLRVNDMEVARRFYVDFLGMTEESLGLDWVTRFVNPATGATIQVLTRDATAPEDPAITVKIDDVQAAWAAAQEQGYEILLPLTSEEWGVTRFFMRSPDGGLSRSAESLRSIGSLAPGAPR